MGWGGSRHGSIPLKDGVDPDIVVIFQHYIGTRVWAQTLNILRRSFNGLVGETDCLGFCMLNQRGLTISNQIPIDVLGQNSMPEAKK